MFIQSVVSRAGRVVVSADQLRVALRVASRLQGLRYDESGFRERLKEDFDSYLVSEPGPVDQFPVWRTEDGEIVLICADLCTGRDLVHGVRGFDYGAAGTGCIDAPAYVPGGGCKPYVAAFNEVCAVQLMVARGAA